MITLTAMMARSVRIRSIYPVPLVLFLVSVCAWLLSPAVSDCASAYAQADTGAAPDSIGEADSSRVVSPDSLGLSPTAAGLDTSAALFSPEEIPLTPEEAIVQAEAWRLTPKYLLKVSGDANRTRMNHDFTGNLSLPIGMNFTSTIQYSETDELTRNSESVMKVMRNTLSLPNLLGWRMAVNHVEQRQNQSVSSANRATGRFVNNDRSVDVSAVLLPKRLIPPTTLQGNLRGKLSEGLHDFKFDRRITTTAHGVLKHDLLSFVKVAGRGFYRRTLESSEVSSEDENGNPVTSSFDGQGVWADTVGANVKFGRGTDRYLHAYAEEFNQIREYVDLPRNLNNNAVFDLDGAQEEKELTYQRNLGGRMKFALSSRLRLDFEARHRKRSMRFFLQPRRNQSTENTDLAARVSYDYSPQNNVMIELIRNESDREYGPTSTSDNLLKDYSLRFNARHRLSNRTSLTASGETSIQQYFYKKKEVNPQDRDIKRQRAEGSITSGLFRNISVTASFSWNKTKTIWIDTGKSGENNNQTRYNLRMGYSWPITARLKIDQTYGIALDFFDYIYNSADNFLDRTTTFTNVLYYTFSSRLNTRFKYDYLFKDKGSYLFVGDASDRTYFPDRREHQDILTIYVDYRITDRIKYSHRYNYKIRTSKSVRTSSSSVNEEGGIWNRIQGNYPITSRTKLKFSLQKVDRWGKLLSEQLKNYWDFSGEIEILF